MAAGAAIAAVLVGGCSVQGAHRAGGAGEPARGELASNGSALSGQSAWLTMLGATPQSVGAISAASTPGGHGRPAHLNAVVTRIRRCVAFARQLRASGHLAAARAARRSCIRRYLRLRLALLGAIHGQLTVERPGGPRTIAFERGVITTASGGSIIVRALDGTTWTWSLVGDTVVVQARHRVGTSALASGEHVLVVGPVVNGTDDARLIVIHR